MSPVPLRTDTNPPAINMLLDVKKGSKQACNELVWQYADRFFCIAFIGTLDSNAAEVITIGTFKHIFAFIEQSSPREVQQSYNWEWLSQFIVDATAQHHKKVSSPQDSLITEPSLDSSSQIDWETTVILGPQRIKRCISSLPEEQKKVFILRHQLNLSIDQIVSVLNKHEGNIIAWLHRSRIQVVKCLGRS